MPAKRDDRTAPPKAENDARQGIVVARRATGAIVPALPAGHNRALRRGTAAWGQAALRRGAGGVIACGNDRSHEGIAPYEIKTPFLP